MSVAVQLELPFVVTAKQRRAELAEWLEARGQRGVTVAEVRSHLQVHHGVASSMLSAAHERGDLVRLVERRDRCSVYVRPDQVAGRDVRDYGRAKGGVPRPLRPVIVQGPTPADVQHQVDLAFEEGRTEGAEAVAHFATRVREAVLLKRPGVRLHKAGCYLDHPECALEAAIRFADRGAGSVAKGALRK